MSKVIFPPRGEFFDTLKARVDNYFTERNLAKSGGPFIYFKALTSFALAIASYLALVFWADTWWEVLLAAFGLTQGYILVAFNVMHDSAHGSFSKRRWVNQALCWAMELIGASHALWIQKHNLLHHTYTNIHGKDEDIAMGSLMRFSPEQPWRPWHRIQHWYALPLYCLLTLHLSYYAEFKQMILGHISGTPLQNQAPRDWLIFLTAKVLYVGYALILPMLFHPPLKVILVFLGIQFLFGLTLAIVFQLAHIVQGAAFPAPDKATGCMPEEWSRHQISTTADFAPNNPLVSWYMGGLNFQVEHHLFHKISHVHYPALRAIVESTCAEFSVRYLCFPSVGSAIRSHFRLLRELGQKPCPA